MKKKTAALISVIIAAAMIMAVIVPAIFGMLASADNLNDKYNQNNKEKETLRQQINDKKSERKDKEAEKNRIDDEIAVLSGQIDGLNQKIAQNEREIREKEEEIAQVEDDIEESNDLLKLRLRIMYENGTASYLEILFSATSFSDLLVRADMVQQLMEHDQELIARLNERKDGIKAAKEQIEAKKQENEAAKASIAQQKSALDTKSAQSQQIISQLREDESYLEEQYRQREAENAAILREIQAAAAKSSNVTAAYSGGQLGWPSTLRGTITSEFGARTFRGRADNHTGIDIAVPMGTPVLAAEDGVVVGSGWRNSYGNCITINHGSITTLYAHNSVLQVSVGQSVKKGQQIALAGSTGNSTGPHIHFGVIDNSTGRYMNPRPYIF